MKKKTITITYSCFGKHLKMQYEKKTLLKDYEVYKTHQTLANKPIDSIKIIIRQKMFELMSDLLKSEHSHCHCHFNY